MKHEPSIARPLQSTPDVQRPVIVSMGLLTPQARSLAGLADLYAAGEDGIGPVTRFDSSRFISGLAASLPEDVGVSIGAGKAEWYDRATLIALGALAGALEDAQPLLRNIPCEQIAVCLGSSHSGLMRSEDVARFVIGNAVSSIDPRMLAATFVSHCSQVVARLCGAKGRVQTISSACASSNSALGIAADMIRYGDAAAVIAGGADTVSLSVMAGFNTLHALADDRAVPFGEVIGLNVGEGAGIMVITSLAAAQQAGLTPLAEILGYGLSGDAHHATAPDPRGDGAVRAMMAALADSQVTPAEITFINSHGTGTDANDAAETISSERLFGKATPIASLKGALGHTLGASGVLELGLALEFAKRGYAPHTLRLKKVRSNCADLDYVRFSPRAGQFDIQICNNYGFGGHNSSLVTSTAISKSPRPRPNPQDEAIAVTGLGIVSAAGIGANAFFDALVSGDPLWRIDPETGLYSANAPDCQLAEGALRPFARTSPMTRSALVAAREALGASAGAFRKNPRAGVVAGMVFGAQKNTEKYMESVFVGDPALANAHHFPMTTMNATTGQLGIAYGIEGYTATLAGSASATLYGFDVVARGRQDRMLIASCDELTPTLLRLYRQSGVLHRANAADSAFGRARALAECGVALTCETWGSAVADGRPALARISGWEQTNDPKDLGVCATGDAYARALSALLTRVGWNSAEVDLLITLGGGMPFSARAERRALRQIFGPGCPSTRVISDVVGYAPSGAALLAVSAGILAVARVAGYGGRNFVNSASDVTRAPVRVIVGGYDLTGACFAVAIEGATIR